jgi:hypothetical protein
MGGGVIRSKSDYGAHRLGCIRSKSDWVCLQTLWGVCTNIMGRVRSKSDYGVCPLQIRLYGEQRLRCVVMESVCVPVNVLV